MCFYVFFFCQYASMPTHPRCLNLRPVVQPFVLCVKIAKSNSQNYPLIIFVNTINKRFTILNHPTFRPLFQRVKIVASGQWRVFEY